MRPARAEAVGREPIRLLNSGLSIRQPGATSDRAGHEARDSGHESDVVAQRADCLVWAAQARQVTGSPVVSPRTPF
jgi:hypothetical protein